MKVRISFLFLTGMIILILFPKFIKIKNAFSSENILVSMVYLILWVCFYLHQALYN